LDLSQDQEKYWDGVANQKKIPVPFRILEFEKFASKESRILDIGCGYGRTLAELHQTGFQNLTGVDFSQGMIDRGHEEFPFLELEKTNGKDFSFPDDSFDAVILLSVLTCLAADESQRRLLSEIRRLLKPNGILYISDFLLNQDRRNVERYEKHQAQYGTFGVFELPEGAVVRHHSKSYVLGLMDCFQPLMYEPTVYTTMNGHESNGFFLIARKR
jgi:SAM-dependent methyltransferase